MNRARKKTDLCRRCFFLRWAWCYCYLLVLLLPVSAWGQGLVVNKTFIDKQLEIYYDPTGVQTPPQRFTLWPFESYRPSRHQNQASGNYWIRMRVRPPLQEVSEGYVLATSGIQTRKLDIYQYIPQTSTLKEVPLQFRQVDINAEKDLASVEQRSGFSLLKPIKEDSADELYIRVPAANIEQLQIQILANLNQHRFLPLILLGAKLGLMLIALYQFAFYPFVRSLREIYFPLFFIGWGFYLLGLSPLDTFQGFLGFESQNWNFTVSTLGAVILLFAVQKFSKENRSIWKSIQQGVLGIFIFSAFLGIFLPEIARPFIMSPPAHILFSLVITISTFIHFRREQKSSPDKIHFMPQMILTVSWSVTTLAAFLWLLQDLGTLSVIGSIPFYLADAAFIFGGLAMMFRLGDVLKRFEDAMGNVHIGKEKLDLMTRTAEKFVPKQFLDILSKREISEMSNGEAVKRDVTLLFSDIQSFTKMSTNMTPEESFQFLSNYLSRTGKIVYRHHGFIDKFIGDAVMGIFGHKPEDAIDCAISVNKFLRLYNLLRTDKEATPVIAGVGINSGPSMIGILGTGDRLESTVISDAVNMAAHVESLTRIYKSAVIITENTRRRLNNPYQYFLRHLDSVVIKGYEHPTDIYEVLDAESQEVRINKIAIKSSYEEALTLFKSGDYIETFNLLKRCQKRYPKDQPTLLQMHRCWKRIQEIKNSGGKISPIYHIKPKPTPASDTMISPFPQKSPTTAKIHPASTVVAGTVANPINYLHKTPPRPPAIAITKIHPASTVVAGTVANPINYPPQNPTSPPRNRNYQNTSRFRSGRWSSCKSYQSPAQN